MNIIVVGCGKVGLTLADQLNKEGQWGWESFE